jgi:uncharacterized protein YceK
MAFRAICVALLLSILPIAGCGTVANLARAGTEGGKIPFGGVKQDVGSIKKAENGEFVCGTHPTSASVQPSQVALMLLCAADLPFSFIGDVVTWPYTSTYCYINKPIPTPPVILAPPVTQTLPVTQATAEDRPQTTP